MTAIVGLEHGGHVYIGADSACTSGNSLQLVRTPKVWVDGQLIIGFCGSLRFGQILRYSLNVPSRSADMDEEEYVVTVVARSIRDTLETSGYLGKDDERDDAGGGALIGYAGGLYELCSDFGLTRHAEDYGATGSGYREALGSLFTSGQLKQKMKPEARLRLALEASAKHSSGVLAPFVILSV